MTGMNVELPVGLQTDKLAATSHTNGVAQQQQQPQEAAAAGEASTAPQGLLPKHHCA